MDFEKAVQDLAKKALDAEGKENAVLRVFALVVFFAMLWWTQYQLAAKERELAAAKARADKAEVDALWNLLEASREKVEAETKAVLMASLEDAQAALAKIHAAQFQLAETKQTINAVKTWQDLNRIAGVAP